MTVPNTTVEIGFDLSSLGGPFFTLDDPVAGVLDNTEFVLGGTLFYDVSQYLLGVQVDRGKSRELDRYSAGQTSVIFDNRARTFDPLNTTSPYYGQIIPHREIRVRSNGTAVFQGLIDDWNLLYQPSGDNQAVAIASDGFTLLATQTLSAHTAISQLTGARITAVLDRNEVQWPTDTRTIDTGQATLQADIVDEGTNALDYLQTVNLSEPGAIFIGKNGYFNFQERVQPISSTGIQSFTDDGTGIPFNNLQVVYGSEQLYNRINITRLNGTTQTANDTDSQTQYGISTLEQDGLLLNTDSDADLLAEYLLTRYSEPEYRFEALELEMANLTTIQQNNVLSLELTDVIQVKFTPNRIGSQINKYAQITGIQHRTNSISHSVTIRLSTLDYANFVLNDTIFGVLDTSALGF
jgi:hypothetical protein